jgi:hypothetical protein
MASTPGWQAAAKAVAAQSVLEATTAGCEALLAELLETHLDEGQRDAAVVARYVDEHFLANVTAPGLAFFDDTDPEAATLKPVATRHAAAFDSWRRETVERLPDRFRATLERRERRIPLLEVPGMLRRARESRPVFAFLIATAVLSACGISLLDVARKVFALL